MKSTIDETQTQWQLKNPYLPITYMFAKRLNEIMSSLRKKHYVTRHVYYGS